MNDKGKKRRKVERRIKKHTWKSQKEEIIREASKKEK